VIEQSVSVTKDMLIYGLLEYSRGYCKEGVGRVIYVWETMEYTISKMIKGKMVDIYSLMYVIPTSQIIL
jgi:hypothetical protein